MISTIAELLHRFIEAERTRLDQFHLSHGPTIGLMYEGLTSEVLNRAIPKDLGLSVASGFITDDSGHLSPQIDCMLVSGNGEPIPYTNFYKWHIKEVIAVLEIKKTLYSSELVESYDTLRAVLDNQSRYVRFGKSSRTYDISSALRAFSEITGTIAPERSKVQSLPFDKEMIYHALICERISPVRIALGYDGFQSEYSLRESLAKFVEKTLMKPGFGVTSYPQLIISGQYSLAKMNGQPYSPPQDKGDWWNFLASSCANPVKLILEFIWTRRLH